MKVSIVTVTLNAAAFLDDCINSVINQDYPDIEYILIDGASADRTPEIIHKYKAHIQHFLSEKDGNQYEALNKGISLATGEIIGILNADDYLANNQVISHIVKAFITSGADIVYGDLDYVNRDFTGRITRKWRSEPFRPALLNQGWMPAHPAWYVKRDLMERYGAYQPEYGSSSDYELMLRLMKAKGVRSFYLEGVLVKMRTGGKSNVSLKNRLLAAQSDFRSVRDNGIKFPYLAVILKRLLKIPQFLFLRGQ